MSRRKKSRKEKRRNRKRKPLQARSADRHDLYQKSVQEPEADVPFVKRVFRRHYGRPPRVLREDFCGTALFACHWAKSHELNEAYGIDLDPEPLAWGREHNLSQLRPDQAARVKLIEGDVMDVGCGQVDVTCAFNFSYFVFKTRPELLRYFRKARATLGDEGMFFLDIYGGPDAQRTLSESREVDGFDYEWDQHLYDPIQAHGINYIHFQFSDGSEMRRAFKYDWRIWSLPEIRDALVEAGFPKTEVYWEATDAKTGDGNGVYVRRESAEDDPAWIAYVAGVL